MYECHECGWDSRTGYKSAYRGEGYCPKCHAAIVTHNSDEWCGWDECPACQGYEHAPKL